MTTCRTCRWLDVHPNAAGKRVPRKERVYPCTAVVEQPKLPISMTRYPGFKWPPRRSVMEPTDGEGCPFYMAFLPAEKETGRTDR